MEWLRELGVRVVDLHSRECIDMLVEFTRRAPGALGGRHWRVRRAEPVSKWGQARASPHLLTSSRRGYSNKAST